MAGRRKKSKNGIPRMVFVALSLLLQVGWILLLISRLNQYSTVISLITGVAGVVAVLRLYSRNTNNAYKMPWILLMMALPVMGLSLYLMVETAATPRKSRDKIRRIREKMKPGIRQDPVVTEELEKVSVPQANLSRYLWNYAQAPVYGNTDVRYYGRAEQAYHSMKEDLKKAEKFIFLEYFIVEDGESFEEILSILREKARQGVQVRLIYDDVGSIGYVDLQFARRLNEEGIQCRVFNPAVPVLNIFMNHRDHRKIMVIDGKVGYTGGYNLADEYFGITHPYGDWKDTGLRLEGDAVASLTATFLELWGTTEKTPEDPAPYLDVCPMGAADGFVQPFGDNPLEIERTAESVYINMICQAERYVWFMTPYLIITDEMRQALCLAAKRGVDVRIITPGVPDKRTVYAMTRSYYAGLISQGVRIYEYAPGFLHAKQCVCDGVVASVGTSNLDYRSLYLHFENDVVLYRCAAVKEIEEDFRQTMEVSREVTDQYRAGRSTALRVWQCILRLVAPLM